MSRPFPPAALPAFTGTTTSSDVSPGRVPRPAVLCLRLPPPLHRARPPVFSVFLSSRAVPVTPEERLGASAERPSRVVRPSSC
jgi:hypothetical protein